MNRLSVIGTAAAWLNYRKAKREYEALQEQADVILAAVDTYNDNKNDKINPELNESIYDKDNIFPEDIKASTVLKVSYMVGNDCYIKPCLVITNFGTESYTLTFFEINCKLLDLPVVRYVKDLTQYAPGLDHEALERFKLPNYENLTYTLKPKETKEFALETGRGAFLNMDAVRDVICQAAGKRLITSCPKINIEGVEMADIRIKYYKSKLKPGKYVEQENEVQKRYEGWIYDQPGILRYEMEVPI